MTKNFKKQDDTTITIATLLRQKQELQEEETKQKEYRKKKMEYHKLLYNATKNVNKLKDDLIAGIDGLKSA